MIRVGSAICARRVVNVIFPFLRVKLTGRTSPIKLAGVTPSDAHPKPNRLHHFSTY